MVTKKHPTAKKKPVKKKAKKKARKKQVGKPEELPKQPDPPKRSNEVAAFPEPGETWEHTKARTTLSPEILSAGPINEFNRMFPGQVAFQDLCGVLKEQSEAIVGGDMSRCESMLAAQATTLDVIFNNLVGYAALKLGENFYGMEAYLKLAFRAQSQCRSTLETLSTIKTPPIFAKQANIAHNQQINNGIPEPSRAREIKNPPNELSEVNHELLPDKGASTLTGEIDSQMETVGEIDRAANGRR